MPQQFKLGPINVQMLYSAMAKPIRQLYRHKNGPSQTDGKSVILSQLR